MQFLQRRPLQTTASGSASLLKAFVDTSMKDMELTIHNLVKLSEMSPPQRVAYSNAWIVLKLLLVMPPTNATSERSFSALRRKLADHNESNTIKQMALNIHSDETDSLNFSSIADEFVGQREGRLRVFGKFNV